MKPTICLVTRGRSDYIHQCLDSLTKCLSEGFADVLVFDNGSTKKSAQIIFDWCAENNVELVRFEQNESSLRRVWQVITDKKLKWVVFPGDDDIFIPESLICFNEIVAKNSHLSCVAFNMTLIENTGKALNLVRKPPFASNVDYHEAAAKSFHEPQFLWPSLFFRADHLPSSVPSSRFYLDWWVGQQLILTGKVQHEDIASIKYRVHELQESSLGNSRRKFFEASFWMLNFIESQSFRIWLQSLGEEKLMDFWRFVVEQKPIYSSEKFGHQVLLSLGKEVLKCDLSLMSKNRVVGDLALEHGVYIKRGELNNFIFENRDSKSNSASNISCIPSPGSCVPFLAGLEFFSQKDARNSTFYVSCSHCQLDDSTIRFDCSQFLNLQGDQIADIIVFHLTQIAEKRGVLDFSVTPFERKQLDRLRHLGRLVPGRLRALLKSILLK